MRRLAPGAHFPAQGQAAVQRTGGGVSGGGVSAAPQVDLQGNAIPECDGIL